MIYYYLVNTVPKYSLDLTTINPLRDCPHVNPLHINHQYIAEVCAEDFYNEGSFEDFIDGYDNWVVHIWNESGLYIGKFEVQLEAEVTFSCHP